MAKIMMALNKIESVKTLEDKVLSLYNGYNSLSKEEKNVLEKMGIDFSLLQKIYVQISEIRKFYESDLNHREIDCDWA